RNRDDEGEGDGAVGPPGGEVRARCLLRRHPEPTQAAARRPTDRGPVLERWIRLRDPERLEQEAAEREKEEGAEEHPVADDVDGAVLVAVGAAVVEPARMPESLHSHERE